MAKRASKSSLSEQGENLKKRGRLWLERIESAWKREDSWAKDAERAVRAYTNEAKGTGDGKLYDYNILHSNVETIVPAIINSPPVPDIRRRFGDADPVAKSLSDIIERAIIVQVDDSRLATELEGQAQDGFLAGRGVIRLRFYADDGENETSALEEAKDAAEEDGHEVGETDAVGEDRPDGEPAAAAAGNDYQSGAQPMVAEQGAGVKNECIKFEAVSWRDYQHGPAKRWEDRPWESFRHVMEKEEITGFADRSLVTAQSEPGTSMFGEYDGDIVVYEIWDKRAKKVLFVTDKGEVVKELPDPLGLTNFFPTSRPVQPIELVGRLMPVTPFSIYTKLADELDILTKRIRIITAAMKIKGAFIGAIAEDIKQLATADDNELIPISGVEMMAQLGGLDKAITWWPVEKFYPVLAELFKNRDLTKQAIYEITGISDIVRGASKASETLGAQQIKSQWGSLRIQKMQRMMERSARDLFVMMAEIIPTRFSYETLEAMTGIPIILRPTDTPEVVQQKLALHQLMGQKITTYYRVDVESESTIRADLTMKKQEAAEFLTGSAAYFAAVGPLVQQGQLPAEAALEIYASNARLFNLGKSVEDTIEHMVQQAKEKAEEAKNNPQPPQPSPEQIKAQAEAQGMQADQQRKQAEFQAKAQEAIAKANTERLAAQAKAEADEADRVAEQERLEAEHMANMAVIRQRAEADAMKSGIEIAKGRKELALKDLDIALKQKALDAPTPQPKEAA